MVSYWKTKGMVQAKVTRAKTGETIMVMEGEKQIFPGMPRGYLLFGKLSKLKHEIKNQIFNWAWKELEDGEVPSHVIKAIERNILPRIIELAQETKYERVPLSRMSPPVRELHRAWSVIAPQSELKEIVCFILEEDDAYRFRFQWMMGWFKPRFWKNPLDAFDYALSMLEHGEVIDDMKERERLFRRILMHWLRENEELFRKFVKTLDRKKVMMRENDKFHFRAKYFKVDLDLFEY